MRVVRAWRWWVELVSRRETGESLALFRILTGIGLLWNLISALYAGVVEVIWFDRSQGGYRELGDGGAWLIELLGGPSPQVVSALVGVALMCGVLLVIGLGGRIVPLLAGQSIFALSMINSETKGSYDALLCNALWLLVLADANATWSLDARLFTGKFRSDRTVLAFPRYLAVVQLAVVYFFNGIQKISAHWTFGGGFSALYYILQQPTWHRFDMTWAAHVYPLTQVGTMVTWLFELSAPAVLLWCYTRSKPPRIDLRLPFVLVGIMLHLGILILLEVGPFSITVLAFYPCLFGPGRPALGRLWTVTMAERRASTV